MNKTLFQFFHWYYSSDGILWQHAADEAEHLAHLGISHVWLPPAYKSAKGVTEPGYAVYDLYDLGEFDQKGAVRTKYGTREEYLKAIESFQKAGIQVLADIVLNHKMGGDENEVVQVQTVKADNRNEFVSNLHTTEANTKFTFPGRQGQYSDYVWDKHSFSGFRENGDIKMILNEHTNGKWEEVVGDENGNYDYLMGKDIEFRNPHVREELKNWGRWYTETTGIDGFRLDGLKHITPNFYPEWLEHLRASFNKDFVVIGEYWKSDIEALSNYIHASDEKIALFDVPLHFNFHEASRKGSDYDMRTIFDNTLVKNIPGMSVPFVDNHDTQPLQALESTVDAWFKPLAYAMILLRKDGFPCVFYASIYEAQYKDEKDGNEIEVDMKKVELLPLMMQIRKELAYGEQYDYLDHEHIVGWTRTGTDDMKNSGIAVLLSNANAGEKIMSLGEKNAGRKMVDAAGNQLYTVTLDDKGIGCFKVGAKTLSIWVDEEIKDSLG